MEKQDDKSNTESKPNFISKEEADKKGDFAQDLDDEITDIVDYGDLGDDKKNFRNCVNFNCFTSNSDCKRSN